MIDFHTHSLLSDGVLVPAEHIRRAEVKGYRVLGFADHGDLATIEALIATTRMAAERENELGRMTVLAGVEITHVRPDHIAEAVRKARKYGAQFVVCHGETIAEPVLEGSNRAAIEAEADILAHPGLITPEDVKLAAKRGVYLEISSKGGHCLCNGHVVRLARDAGAKVLFGSDAHTPDQMPTRDYAERVCRGAGLSDDEVAATFAEAEAFAERVQSG
jgi:histidinol phosphatase-like PHP family hydrolase